MKSSLLKHFRHFKLDFKHVVSCSICWEGLSKNVYSLTSILAQEASIPKIFHYLLRVERWRLIFHKWKCFCSSAVLYLYRFRFCFVWLLWNIYQLKICQDLKVVDIFNAFKILDVWCSSTETGRCCWRLFFIFYHYLAAQKAGIALYIALR